MQAAAREAALRAAARKAQEEDAFSAAVASERVPVSRLLGREKEAPWRWCRKDPPPTRSPILDDTRPLTERLAGASRPAWLYTAALHPADEPQRLAELRGFGILDTEPDEDYDRLVQLAAVLCGAPMGALTFVDAGRQWYKSRVGLPVQQIAAREVLLRARDPRVRPRAGDPGRRAGSAGPTRSPGGRTGPTLRFYAGVPLTHPRRQRHRHAVRDGPGAAPPDRAASATAW